MPEHEWAAEWARQIETVRWFEQRLSIEREYKAVRMPVLLAADARMTAQSERIEALEAALRDVEPIITQLGEWAGEHYPDSQNHDPLFQRPRRSLWQIEAALVRWYRAALGVHDARA